MRPRGGRCALLPARVFWGLDRLDERTRTLEVVSSADAWQIRGVKPGGARPSASPMNVARKMTEASIRSAFALVPDDHHAPPGD